MSRRIKQSGFTAIELLITLFIAAAFLIAGYQLFNVIVRDGGQARDESRAGNVAYDYMRRYSASAVDPCMPRTPLSNQPITVDGLADARITIKITCPDYSTTSLSKVEATVTYDNPEQTVKYATFVNGGVAMTGDVTDSLVGRWTFNGNANDTIGTHNGTASNVSNASGQNNTSNSAYTFNGSTSSVSVGTDEAFSSAGFTLSAWVRPTTLNSANTIMAKETSYKYRLNSSGQLNVMLNTAGTGSWTTNVTYTGTAISTNTWAHVVMTFNEDTRQITGYINGAQVGTTAGSIITGFSSQPLVIGSYNTSGSEGFTGQIDDARFYNRALTATEVSYLYSRGAQ